ncbi:MAG: hypothetical protein CSA21_05980 [Deltaproteobacteria bacterium]|nr:MAG: hypothetical protein CSA21_05980 [Deltaproteobacteria bacterium]
MKTLFAVLLRIRPQLVRGICCLALALLLIFSAVVDRSHGHSWVERSIPFFWSMFAFVASAAIIGLTRWLGGMGIQARLDLYARDSVDEDAP